MSRMVGTVSMGIRAPIIRSGDDLVEIVTNSVLETVKDGALTIRDRDVIAMTEAIVARAQGNYASVDDIAADVRAKLGGETVGVAFPILSRNRFAICLRGIAKGARKVVLMLSYPSDEVGNHLIDVDAMDEKGVDPYKDVLTLERYRELFGYTVHPFTGVDYVAYFVTITTLVKDVTLYLGLLGAVRGLFSKQLRWFTAAFALYFLAIFLFVPTARYGLQYYPLLAVFAGMNAAFFPGGDGRLCRGAAVPWHPRRGDFLPPEEPFGAFRWQNGELIR